MNTKLAEAFKLAREKAVNTSRLEYALETRVLARIREREADQPSDSLVGWLGLQMAGLAGLIVIGLFVGYEVQAQELTETSFRILSGGDATSWLF